MPDPYAARGRVRTASESQPPVPDDERLPDEPGLVGEVPDGTVDAVVEWVGDDADRAQAALMVERAQPNQRKTLLARLEAMVNAADA